jgi:hypothetical protein
MGNRSKFVAAGGIAAAVLASRRRARARAVAEGIADTILPSQSDAPLETEPLPHPGEAPGHGHRISGERGETSERSGMFRRSVARQRPRLVRR